MNQVHILIDFETDTTVFETRSEIDFKKQEIKMTFTQGNRISYILFSSDVRKLDILGFRYYLVSYSENIDDYFTAMGTEQSLLWMARAFDERVSFWNTDGDRTMHTKLSWKFCKFLKEVC